MIIMLLIYITSIWTRAVATVDASGAVVPGPALAITGVVDNLYGIAVVIHAIVLLIKDKEGFRKKEYIAHILFILICTVGGVTDAIVSDTPVMPMAIMLSFNVLFIILQETKIFNDALTGLNNRRLADRYISSAIKESSVENPICVFMMDIDDFKIINDRYGHLEGDKALKQIAEALMQAVSRYRGFLARWGGDEFVVALTDMRENTIERFRADLKHELSKLQDTVDIPVELNLSIGEELCADQTRSLADVIEKADESLYMAKANKKPIVL